MRSAQRRAKSEKIKGNSRRLKTLIKLFAPVVIALVLFIFLKFTTKYWDGNSKVSFVFQKPSGDVGIVVIDPVLTELTTLIIPADTEVEVARNYGSFRIKNVWQLGVYENLGGDLLAETITKGFLFPTFLWSGLDLSNPWKFLISSKNTNIPFGDRLKIVVFILKVKGIDKNEIDMGKNQFLKKQILTDGESGYVTNGFVSTRLTVYFSDNNISSKNLKFALIDSTAVYGVANNVGSILEVLGGKVVSIERRSIQSELDCKVYGNDVSAKNLVKNLLNCTITLDNTDFDLVVEIGNKFAKRF